MIKQTKEKIWIQPEILLPRITSPLNWSLTTLTMRSPALWPTVEPQTVRTR